MVCAKYLAETEVGTIAAIGPQTRATVGRVGGDRVAVIQRVGSALTVVAAASTGVVYALTS